MKGEQLSSPFILHPSAFTLCLYRLGLPSTALRAK
jgi:hypothetical protein